MKATKTNTISTGLAMFSMFFGAGNVVFPLAIGQYAQSNNFYAVLGLLLTAVGVPFIGLMAMTLFDGNYKHFFERIGKTPGFLVSLIIMGLIGPFGALPRCIALSYSTIKMSLPSLSLPWFSFFSCLLIYCCTYKKRRLLDVLGYVLTPILLISLTIIIVKGLLLPSEAPPSPHFPLHLFFTGLKEGYQTMDLLGAFFFSSVVLLCLKRDLSPEDQNNHRRLVFLTLKAGCIGMSLLSLVYIGFSYLAATHSIQLQGIPKDALLGVIAFHVLGPYAGLVASLAVAMACLTTAIALSAVFAQFLEEDIFHNKICYRTALIMTLVIAYFVSILNFTVIAAFLAPILQVAYPALILLSVLNLFHKLYHFQPVKIPFFITLVLSLIGYFI